MHCQPHVASLNTALSLRFLPNSSCKVRLQAPLPFSKAGLLGTRLAGRSDLGQIRLPKPPASATSMPEVEHSEAQILAECKVAVYSSANYVCEFLAPSTRDVFPQCTFIEARLDIDTAALAAGYDAVCLFVNDDASAPVLEKLAAGGVRFVAMRCAGFDRVDLEALYKLGMKIARVPTYSPHSVAEQAVTLALALNRNIVQAYNRVRTGNYTLSGLVGMEVHNKTVGVIGTGAIGVCAARIFQGFGCRVIAQDIREAPVCLEMGVEYVELEYLLKEADIISLHVPLLPSTFHLICRERIETMKQGVILLNVSRGGLVDTDALIDGLQSGRIGGVGMDVYEGEGSLFFRDYTQFANADRMKFWDRRFQLLVSFPNVIITPHSAFLTREALSNIAESTIANLREFALGQDLTYAVKIVH